MESSAPRECPGVGKGWRRIKELPQDHPMSLVHSYHTKVGGRTTQR